MAPSASRSRGWWALGASIALHLTLTQVAGSATQEHPAPLTGPEPRDAWTGTTFDVDAVLEAPAPPTRPIATSTPAPAAEPKAPVPAAPKSMKAAEAAVRLEQPPPPKTVASAAAGSRTEPDRARSAPRDRTRVEHERRKPPNVARSSTPTGDTGADATRGLAQTIGDAGATLRADGEAPSYGAAGDGSGERNLGKAFTRVLPRATNSDSIWDRLPIGYAARVYARLQTNAEGRVVAADAWLDGDAAAAPPELERLVKRAAGLLGTGQFALPGGVGTGAQTLRIDVLLKQGSRSDDFLAEGQDTVELGFDPPSPGRPGRAFFRKASGRTLEMRVTIVSR